MKTSMALTRYIPGSLKELSVFAAPLMVIALSDNVIIALDRLILSHYSLDAFNAVSLSSQFIEVLQYMIWSVTSMTELFIARLFSSDQKKEMGIPCWQMIYLSISTLPLVFLLGRFTGTLLLDQNYQSLGLPYYQIMIYSVPLVGVITALSGFFVGQGKLKRVLYSSLVANIINIILDFALIFGIKNFIPALGPKGAAISAIFSLSLQAIWLFTAFLNKSHRSHYNTRAFGFNVRYFAKSLKIGIPVALVHSSDLLGWLVLMFILSQTSDEIFTIVAVGNTLYLIFSFFIDGLYRSLSTIVSNHLAAKRYKAISNSILSGLKLLGLALLIVAIPVLLFPNCIFQLFNLKESVAGWHHILTFNFVFIWVFFALGGLLWLFYAILTAYRDTKFLMLVNIASLWLTVILPIYLLSQYASLNPKWLWSIINIYALIATIAVVLRYVQKRKMF